MAVTAAQRRARKETLSPFYKDSLMQRNVNIVTFHVSSIFQAYPNPIFYVVILTSPLNSA